MMGMVGSGPREQGRKRRIREMGAGRKEKEKQQVTEEEDPGEDRWRLYRGRKSALRPRMSVPRQLRSEARGGFTRSSPRRPDRHTPATGVRRPIGSRGEPGPAAPANQRRAGSAANGRCSRRPGPRNPRGGG